METRRTASAVAFVRTDDPTEADVHRIYATIPAHHPFRTTHASWYRGIVGAVNQSVYTHEEIIVLQRLWYVQHCAAQPSNPRLPYGPAAAGGEATKLEQQQKHIMLWLALLKANLSCYTCHHRGRTSAQCKLDTTLIGHGRNEFVEWHHIIDPPDYAGYDSRYNYSHEHPERFVGQIMNAVGGAKAPNGIFFGTLDRLAVELPKCVPVHGKLQTGMPGTCHDMAPEHRAVAAARGLPADVSTRGRTKHALGISHSDTDACPRAVSRSAAWFALGPRDRQLATSHYDWKRRFSTEAKRQAKRAKDREDHHRRRRSQQQAAARESIIKGQRS